MYIGINEQDEIEFIKTYFFFLRDSILRTSLRMTRTFACFTRFLIVTIWKELNNCSMWHMNLFSLKHVHMIIASRVSDFGFETCRCEWACNWCPQITGNWQPLKSYGKILKNTLKSKKHIMFIDITRNLPVIFLFLSTLFVQKQTANNRWLHVHGIPCIYW